MGKKTANILVVDDEEDYCSVLDTILSSEGYEVDTCYGGATALKKLQEKHFDAIVTDLCMPGMGGDELLCSIKERNIPVEVIIMTAYGTVEKAVQTMKAGAFTYITKGGDPMELLCEIERIIEKKKMEKDNLILKGKVKGKNFMLDCKSGKFRQVLILAERAAQSNSNILILGESGSGKEVLASYIHDKSKRREENFMEMNCQALSESILESELFGHEKGAFTGAAMRRIGLFEAANLGTLFLDEIGGVSINLQAKLLKAIENKQIYRLGSNIPLEVDFRLITATNRDLQRDMRDGKFRSDLFYRLSTIVLELPSLRERREDIPMFIDYFLEKYETEMKKTITSISERVKNFLLEYDYPGNIRELKNIIERLIVLSENGEVKEEHLPPDIIKALSCPLLSSCERECGEVPLRAYRNAREKEYIEELLRCHPHDLNKVAEILEITRRQLFNKLVEYGLK